MAKPTFVSYTSIAVSDVDDGNYTDKSSAAIPVQINDRVVVWTIVEDYDTTQTAAVPTDSQANSYASPQFVNASSYTQVRVDTTTATATNNLTVILHKSYTSGSNKFWGGGVFVFRASDGFGNSNKDNATNAPGNASVGVTTAQANSALVTVNGDWDATDGTTRTWLTVNSVTPSVGNGLETYYFRDAAHCSAYAAYYDDAGSAASKTAGLSAPTGQTFSMVALEVRGTADGGNDLSANLQDPVIGGSVF